MFIHALLVILLTCIASASPDASFTFRLRGEPKTFDWNRADTLTEAHLLMNLMEGLLSYDDQGRLKPALAKQWRVSPDGRTYLFTLRDDVRWTDGIPLKAGDFVFSWKRLLTASTAAPYAYLLFDVEGAEDFYKGVQKDFARVGIHARGDRILEVKLAWPTAHWPHLLALWPLFPLREDVVTRLGAKWEKPENLVTLGAFSISKVTPGQKVILVKNPGYQDPRGNIERITALLAQDDSSAVALFETGRLDFIAELSSFDLKRFAGKPELKTVPFLKTSYLGFAQDKAPANRVEFRRAVAMAIDKKGIAQILGIGQKAAESFVPPALLPAAASRGLSFDPARAKAELEKAGLKQPRAQLLVFNGEKELLLAQYLQNQLRKNAGIEISVEALDHRTFRSYLQSRTYPMFENSWSADFADPDNFLSLFLSTSGTNRIDWNNAEYDRLIRAARAERSEKKRQALYHTAQKLLLEKEVAIVPLYHESNSYLLKKGIKGLHISPLGHLILKNVVVTK